MTSGSVTALPLLAVKDASADTLSIDLSWCQSSGAASGDRPVPSCLTLALAMTSGVGKVYVPMPTKMVPPSAGSAAMASVNGTLSVPVKSPKGSVNSTDINLTRTSRTQSDRTRTSQPVLVRGYR